METPAWNPWTPASGTQRRPRIFYGWYLVAGSILTNTVLSAAYFQGMSAFSVSIEAHFGWSRSVVGGAMSLRQMESGIMSPMVGFLLDKVKPRTLLLWSAVITGLGLIGLGMINGILTFYPRHLRHLRRHVGDEPRSNVAGDHRGAGSGAGWGSRPASR